MRFTYDQLNEAVEFHSENGFVVFPGLLRPELGEIRAAVDRAVEGGRLILGDDKIAVNNDIVFADPALMDLCKHPKIVTIQRRLTGCPVELQHAKFNAKPDTGGDVPWHQDFPFYPHTNYDLVSCGVHLDDEDLDSGPLEFVPGSHDEERSHLNPDGRFAYRCTETEGLSGVTYTGSAGDVTFHHCLTLHRSLPKRRPGPRRLIVFQYRAVDAIQIAGVIWKCNGLQVEDLPENPRMARFPDGSSTVLRGVGGRLFDVEGQLAPD